MRATHLLFVALAIASPVQAQQNTRERTTDLTAASGAETRAGHFENSGGRGCPNSAGTPSIVVTQPPVNGTLVIREGDALYGQPLLGGVDIYCHGKTLHGMHIYYRSRPGYSGPDMFAYKVVLPRGTLLTTTHVRVE